MPKFNSGKHEDPEEQRPKYPGDSGSPQPTKQSPKLRVVVHNHLRKIIELYCSPLQKMNDTQTPSSMSHKENNFDLKTVMSAAQPYATKDKYELGV